jgi:hypothetical protein
MLKPTSKILIYGFIDKVVVQYLKKAKLKPSNNSGNPFVMAIFEDFEPLLHRIHGAKTSLGTEMEKIAEIIAKDAWGSQNVRRKIHVEVELPSNVFREIDSIINELSNAKKLPNYQAEKERIFQACNSPSKKTEKHTYEFDMELYDVEKKHWYNIEMKGPDPNTTEVSGAKKRLMTEMAWIFYRKKYRKIDSLFGIYYNNKFPKPYKNPKVLYYFDPDGGLLVSDSFWNFLGKSVTTYKELLKIFREYGKKNKKRIWDGFSGLVKEN